MHPTSKSLALLRELARLLDQFGPDAFVDLAGAFSDPHLCHAIAAVLTEVPSRAPKTRPKKERRSSDEAREDFRAKLEQLKRTEPQKGGQLLELYDMLRSKSALPSLRELVAFMSNHGLEVPKVKSRDKVLMSLVNSCKSLPLANLDLLLAELRADAEPGDRTLADWGKVILNRHRDDKV